MSTSALKRNEEAAAPTEATGSKVRRVSKVGRATEDNAVKSTITYGAVTINVERATGEQRARNVAQGTEALRRAAKRLAKPGVTLDLPASAPRYRADPEVAGRLVRVLNGKESVGTFVNGVFKPAK